MPVSDRTGYPMKIENGYPFYGQSIGVLVFNQKTPRIPGDPGHNATFAYPVCYQIVEGGFSDLIQGSPKIEAALVEGALSLKEKGVRAIVGDCGLMALYQDLLATKTGLPVMASALSLLPLAWTAIGRSGKIGILTGHSEMLSQRHLKASGCTPEMGLAVQGLQEEPHFAEIVIGGGAAYIPAKMRTDLLNSAAKLLRKASDVRALLVECSNLPTFSADLREETRLPVFDIATAANLMEACVNPVRYLTSQI